MIGMGLKVIGDLAYCEKRFNDAQSLYEKSLDQYLDLGQNIDVAGIQCGLGNVYLNQGNISQAVWIFQKSLEVQTIANNQRGIFECFLGIGALAGERKFNKRAIQLLTAVVILGGKGILYSNPVQQRVLRRHGERDLLRHRDLETGHRRAEPGGRNSPSLLGRKSR